MAGDLVELAGGTGAILERAREKQAAGRPEEALHLLDVIKDAGTDTAESRELGIEIHQALLDTSENFWLSAWLRNQIKLLGS